MQTVAAQTMNIPFVDLKCSTTRSSPRSTPRSRPSSTTPPSSADRSSSSSRRRSRSTAAWRTASASPTAPTRSSIALRALGIGAGDEVITVGQHVRRHRRGDHDRRRAGRCSSTSTRRPTTSTPAQIEARSRRGPRRSSPVHLYGQPADMDADRAIAAQARPARDRRRRAGARRALQGAADRRSSADIACFSFYPGKNLGAYGDGGALVTGRRASGRRRRGCWPITAGRKKYDHDLEGVNSRLDGLQAAILSVKLRSPRAVDRGAAPERAPLQPGAGRCRA